MPSINDKKCEETNVRTRNTMSSRHNTHRADDVLQTSAEREGMAKWERRQAHPAIGGARLTTCAWFVNQRPVLICRETRNSIGSRLFSSFWVAGKCAVENELSIKTMVAAIGTTLVVERSTFEVAQYLVFMRFLSHIRSSELSFFLMHGISLWIFVETCFRI